MSEILGYIRYITFLDEKFVQNTLFFNLHIRAKKLNLCHVCANMNL